jgi:hypothetical protein
MYYLFVNELSWQQNNIFMQIRLLVGAPKGRDRIVGSGVKKVGIVYKCSIKGSCTKIQFNYRGE